MNKEQTNKLLKAYKEIGEILQSEETGLNITKTFKKEDIPKLYELLETQSAYLVTVQYESANVKHKAILFTGLKKGLGFWEIYSNSYEKIMEIARIYTIRVDKKLCNLKN